VSAVAWIGVAALGGLGAIARFLLDVVVSARGTGRFPVGTFAVNVSGAFGLGLVSGLALTGDALVLAGTATLGSYTTFSTWMLESQRLREDNELLAAAANVVLSVGAGLGAIALGRTLG
jgi:fluoride exporter